MKSNTFYNLVQRVTEFIKDKIFEALVVYLKSQVGGWLLGKLIDHAVDQVDKKLADPVLDVLVVKIGHKYDVARARKVIAIMERANETNDERSYRSATDDLIGRL